MSARVPLVPSMPAAYGFAHRPPAASGVSSLSRRHPIGNEAVLAVARPAERVLQRLGAALNQSPRVASLQRIGAMLSGSAVVQRNGDRYELTIPAERSGYGQELSGHEAYRWIVQRHGEAAIQGIKNVASLVFRDGGMFVQAASRDFVVRLLADLHLGKNVAVGGAGEEFEVEIRRRLRSRP